MLPHDEVTGLRWALLGRVSSASQKGNTSTTKQLDALETEVAEKDGNIVKRYDLTESAATVNRDSLEEIVSLAEDDKVDILGVWKLDRLTRASPWDSLLYLNRLREEGVILYAHTHGYFEWDNLYDFEMLARRVAFAREWYQRLIEGGREGQVEKIEQGKWPFGDPPHGYTKADDDTISLTEEGKEINRDMVRLYFEHTNRETVHDRINDIYTNDISQSQVDNILQNQIIAGDLTLKGQVVAHDEALKIIDREQFEKLQEIQQKQSSSPSNIRDIPEPIDRAASRFGVEFVVDLIGSIGTQCRKCESDLQHNGTTERWGTEVRKYECVNEDCGYENPLLKQTEFDNLHQTLPLRCPFCPGTNRYDVEQRSAGFWEYKYTCENCGKSFGANESPNQIRRAMDNPKLAFRWDEKTDSLQTEEKKENETSAESKDSDDSQKTLSAY